MAAPQLAGAPHVVVDGAPRPGTVCTLSHWPGTPTPEELWADVSAEIVLRALARPRLLPRRVELATVDHYDADGVLALGLLVVDGLADAHGPLLASAAHAGDFGVVHSRAAARVAFAVEALAGQGVEEALAVLPALAAAPDRFEALWGAEEAAYDSACRMVAAGAVSIEELPAVDLAVVTVDVRHRDCAAAAWGGAPVHRAAVHSATSCLRVATVAGAHSEVRYRYESWVRLAGRRPRPRVDLSALAQVLQHEEADGGAWAFDGAGAITPALHRADAGPSTLPAGRFVDLVVTALAALDAGPAAWDPYRPAGRPPPIVVGNPGSAPVPGPFPASAPG